MQTLHDNTHVWKSGRNLVGGATQRDVADFIFDGHEKSYTETEEEQSPMSVISKYSAEF